MLKTLLNMSISASYVILWVLALRFLMQKAPKKFSFFLWFIPLFRLLCPVSFTSSLSAFKAIGATSQKGFVSYPVTGGTAVINPPVFPSQISPSPVDIPVSETAQTFDFFSVLPYILAAIWILGAAVMLLRFALSYFKLYRSVKACSKKSGDTLICRNLSAAFVMGFFRPVICLPEGLEGDERAYVLLHEQTHIKRYDYISKLIFYFALCVHWFNPLVWLAYCLFSRDMEMSCDEAVIKKMGDGIKKSYSLSILALSAPSPLSFGQASAKERIVNIMKYKKPAVISVIIAVLAVSAAAVFLLSNPKADTPESSPYKYRTEYVGNNSKVGGIIYSLTFPEDMKYKNFELSENGVTVNFTSDDGAKYMDYNTSVPLRKNGAVMLSLIKNADFVTFRIEDDAETYDVKCTREQTEAIAGTDLWAETSSYKKFTALCSLISKKYDIATAPAIPTDLNTAIREAVLSHSSDYAMDGEYNAESHTVLRTVADGDNVTAYAIVLALSFEKDGDKISTVGGFHMPIALTFDTSKGGYKLIEFWQPEDGEYYASSIAEKFPEDIAEEAMNLQNYVNGLHMSCYAQYINQKNIDWEPIIDALLEEICEYPAAVSYYMPYIEEHEAQYRELIYMGTYTLKYAAAAFEREPKDFLEHYILAEAASEITGLPYGGGSPQKWYKQNFSSIFPMIVDITVNDANVTDTSLDFVIDLSYSAIEGEFCTGKAYTLEVYENGQYTAVQPVTSDNMVFTSEAIVLSEGENWLHVDWENFYGPLEKGQYRMGKEISVSNPDGSQRASDMFYTYFTIY